MALLTNLKCDINFNLLEYPEPLVLLETPWNFRDTLESQGHLGIPGIPWNPRDPLGMPGAH